MPNRENAKPRVLMHSCCAPCTIYPFDRLESEGISVTGFFYNPNIHPFCEFEKRLQAVSDFYRAAASPLIVDASYDVSAFITAIFATGARRCETCWRMRLHAAAARASEMGVDAVTTTLLFSIYQAHDTVAGIGKEESKDAGVEFYYEDFRAGPTGSGAPGSFQSIVRNTAAASSARKSDIKRRSRPSLNKTGGRHD